jgi:hypothetical protein
MSPTHLMTRPAPPRPRAPQLAIALVSAVLLVAFVRVATVAMAVPDVVDRVVIDNDTPYGVDVDLRGSDDGSRLLLGRALPEAETVRREVHDEGDRWIFAFWRGGALAGEVELTRTELEANDWKLAVPDTVEQQLADLGQAPYPEEGDR